MILESGTDARRRDSAPLWGCFHVSEWRLSRWLCAIRGPRRKIFTRYCRTCGQCVRGSEQGGRDRDGAMAGRRRSRPASEIRVLLSVQMVPREGLGALLMCALGAGRWIR